MVRLFEASRFARDGPGEGAALVAKQLAFYERFWQGRAVHRHEGARGPRAPFVERACDEFLAGPGLAEHQDRQVGFRDLLHGAHHLFQRRTLPDDLAGVLGGDFRRRLEAAVILLPRLVEPRRINADRGVCGEYSQSLQVGGRGRPVDRESRGIQTEHADCAPGKHERHQEH